MEREAPFIFVRASCLLRFPTEASWMVLDRKASPKLLNAPLASLAALARSLRSPHRGECSFIFHCLVELVLIFKVVNISVDLSWIFMPTWLHVGLIFRLLVHLGASRARLGASWHVLGASWPRLGASWAGLGVSWERLGSS